MGGKIFACKDCGADVKWNPEFFDAKNKNESLFGLSPTLDIDGAVHTCQKTTSKIKKFTILPGTEYLDFHALDLELGKTIEGFLFRGGLKLCNQGNTIPYTLNVEINLMELRFHLKLISFPVIIFIQKEQFEEEFFSFKSIKLPKKLLNSDIAIISKTLTTITLEQFIGFHYCQDHFDRYIIKHFETGQNIPFKQAILLLLRNHGIEMTGPKKTLILSNKNEVN
ncbi:MAG: hypothetical protein EAX96_20765 [Candidatus Lokiarchaeota archaeon]|nr:hypothetical protein [Candidatus Lokiarchaeota archaeon]